MTRQAYRRLTRYGFFMLFVLAPPLDLFRLDLTLGHFILLGQDWTLGLDPFLAGQAGPGYAVWSLLWRGLLPIVLVVGGGLLIAWQYGRLYCGWLCPHFSVVESINALLLRATGKPTLWEPKPVTRYPDGQPITPSRAWWPLVVLAVVGFALLWAVTLLTYLLPPALVWGNLLNLELSRNQLLFITVATVVFIIEFTFARHLFCRYVCAAGLFQSYAWMANRKALVVDFDIHRARSCADCFAACDTVCPMRLKPRSLKRQMFACTQCTACIDACETVQRDNPAGSLLHWVKGAQAWDKSRTFGRGRSCPSRIPPTAKTGG